MTDIFDDLVDDSEEESTRPDIRAIEETVLIGLVDPTLAPRILEKTRPDDFYFSQHRELATVVYPLALEGQHIDLVTFRAALERIHGETVVRNHLAGFDDDDDNKIKKLFALAGQVVAAASDDPPPAGKVLSYLGIFADQAKKRLARHLVESAAAALDKGEATPEETAAAAFRAIADLEATRRLSGTATTEGEDLDAFFAELEARQSTTNDFQGLDTGFNHLNRVINGLTAGLIVLGAMPSTGKTTFAKQIADQVVEKHSDAAVLFVSMEQSKEELRIKTLSRLSGVENRDLQRGRLDVASTGWQQVRGAKSSFARYAGRLQILEGDRLTTVDRIRLAAIQLRQKTEAKRLLVIVDYLQILPVEKDQDFGDLRQKVNFLVSELRRMGRDLDAPVIAISSVNRVAYGKTRGELEAFKESGEIDFSADVALMLVDDKDKKTGEDKYLGVNRKWRRVFLDVIKNRNGEKDKRIDLDFYPEVSRFKEGGNPQSIPGEG